MMAKGLRHVPTHTRRDAWVEVNLGAIEHNTRQIRRHLPPDVEIMAIVKADAYGHGATMVIPTLAASGVSMVGVAAMDEALQLRDAGLEIPILVIGATPDWAMPAAAEADVQLTIFAEHHLESLQQAYQQTGQPVKVHIKVDTGMHRIGLDYRQAPDFIRRCQTLDYIQLKGIFTHLASGEDTTTTQQQLECWQTVLDQVQNKPRYIHLANTAGTLSFPNTHFNLVRVGIGLYGYAPGVVQSDVILQPAMGLKARIVHIQDVEPESGISYSHTYKTPSGKPSRIATLPLGYSDGVPRYLSNRLLGRLHGQLVSQVGTITMDQLMIDITHLPQAAVGDTVTLLDTGPAVLPCITLANWVLAARQAGASTIEWELMCGLRVRLPKVYTR